MRILYYNWVDYRDPARRGGGVSVYQTNLIEGFAARGGVETAFLSAGVVHDLRPGKPRVITVQGGENPRYALVNSGVVAPAHAHFGGAAQLDHPPTEAAFAAFIERTGPWDVIHFNNLEGLPAQVLALRSRWPNTRFVLSLHNYYPFCPQVNLWHGEVETCPGFDAGRRCATCLTAQPEPRSVRLFYGVERALSRIGVTPGSVLHDKGFRPVLGLAWRTLRCLLRLRHRRRAALAASPAPARQRRIDGAPFARRRARMIALINGHCDAVICVSDRVRQIAEEFGLDPARLHTRYIGTREAAQWPLTQPRDSLLRPDGTLRLAYLGYMRRDKGFYFLMRALTALSPEMARRVRLTVAAGTGEPDAMALMAQAAGALAELRHVNGYSHDQLEAILSDVDLGVVPVIWEDSLPQVAIEMHARHIPLLTSDRGGARELGRCPDLVFRAGDAQDFAAALARVLDGAVQPARYWDNTMPPVGMPEHLDALVALYREI